MKRIGFTGLTTGLFLLASGTASAAPALRVQVNQRGDFALIGNTLAHDCAPATPAPVVGTVGACGTNTSDNAPDVYWRADVPAIGLGAQADIVNTAATARSGAMLNLPAGANVTHAFLYWAASLDMGQTPTNVVKIERPGGGGFNSMITALNVVSLSGNSFYQAVADVTALVQAQGSGYFRLGNFNASALPNLNNNNVFAGWWMAVFYQLPTDPPRNLALFDGFDSVNASPPSNSITATLSGFKVPNAGFKGKLGVIAFEGDNGTMGDGLNFNGSALTNALNPVNDFFNSTRSYDDGTAVVSAVSTVGDLPQLTGTQGSMSGLDIDVVDISSKLAAGQTSATINATTTGDNYFLSGFITSITTFKQDFTTSTKVVSDVNGGAVLVGDVLQYTITVTNSGNDDSVNTIVTDPLPAGVTFVPNSIQITPGAGQGTYDAATNTVVARVGTGATSTQGGTVAVGQSVTVTFQVKINVGATGTISNQAKITASGKQGAPAEDAPTDGNGSTAGAPPTSIPIDACADDTQCAPPTLHCNTAPTPNVCVECLNDSQCSGSKATCLNSACVCVPSGAEVCDGKDNDCNGTVDDDFHVGEACSNGVGICFKAGVRFCGDLTTKPAQCDAIPGEPGAEQCDDTLDSDCDGNPNNGCPDADMDGLPDAYEKAIGTDPTDPDSDHDGVPDGQEPNLDKDTDGDGVINALDPDSDNDGLFDGTELGLDCSKLRPTDPKSHCVPDADMGATKTNPLLADTDGGGVIDGAEDLNRNGKIDAGETDPTAGHGPDDGVNVDTDNDGLPDKLEKLIGTDPNDADSDDDGVLDGKEPAPTADTDGDGLIDALDPDSDNDGLLDGTELGVAVCLDPPTNTKTKHNCVPDADGGATKTNPLNRDTDYGGASDSSEDWNLDGKIDAGETNPTTGHGADDSTDTDTDADGLGDKLESQLGTDPNDGDSDDDGVPDGKEPNPASDTDGDGLIDALDPDSDNDGLFDGTELGLDCSNPATDKSAHHCTPDADMGATKTSPVNRDTDGGGVIDGAEDLNRDGKVEPGETDPTASHGADDGMNVDTDSDGLPDKLEKLIGTNPMDADSDDDGVPDGLEPAPAADTDGDGRIDALDPDSDNDGLFDGTELGYDCAGPGTKPMSKTCIPDGDKGTTKTNPLDRDTDNGGASDGSEDWNLDGKIDAGETDPTRGHGADDKMVVDTDSDGLGDKLEMRIGTSPMDADSDDDGVLDGKEPNPTIDTDGDGKIDALDPDSDNDGLFDGTELGYGCTGPGTKPMSPTCIGDADGGKTTTSPLDADTDHGGLSDGVEDANHNGQIDAGETNPNDPTDDKPCVADSDCGSATSGKVCNEETRTCVDGCRGTGNGCPDGKMCSSTDRTVGLCTNIGSSSSSGMGGMGGAGGGSTSSAGGNDDGGVVAEGNGILCSARPGGGNSGSGLGFILGGALGALLIMRRRRRS
jgi:uncharacterized repeat protein (TIGR01451 family)